MEKTELFKQEINALFKYKVGFNLMFERILEMIADYNLDYDDINEILKSAIKHEIKNLSPRQKNTHNNLTSIVKIAVERIWEKKERDMVMALVMIFIYSGDMYSNWRKLPDILRKFIKDKKRGNF